MTPHHHDLTVRHITGRDELDLFTSLPYVLNDEVAGDLAAGRRRPGVTPAGTTPPAYGRFLPPDWRDRADTSRAVSDRMRALERVGANLFVERLRLEWRPGTPVPEPSGRLLFRPVSDAGNSSP